MSDDNVEWLRKDADFQEHQRENNIAMVPAAEDATRLRACADELAELRKEVERLRASLNLVAQLDGQTLLGPSDLDFDHLTKRVPDQCWAHEVGAARAFNQAAEIAKEALKEHGTL